MLRTEFINKVNDYLLSIGFVNNGNNAWKKTSEMKGQSMTFNINGQSFRQEGKSMFVNHLIEDIGEGYVNKDKFSQFHFVVEQDSNIVIDIEECIYYDEIDLFKDIINRILGN